MDSSEELRFTYEDEDAMMALPALLALSINHCHEMLESRPEQPVAATTAADITGPAVVISHYAANDSIFIDEEYLIKGVAGAIFWTLIKDCSTQQRTEFSNRELRLDTSIGLPDIGDNLEVRLILLQKRLKERCDFLAIEKTGRGRFELRVGRAISLQES